MAITLPGLSVLAMLLLHFLVQRSPIQGKITPSPPSPIPKDVCPPLSRDTHYLPLLSVWILPRPAMASQLIHQTTHLADLGLG